MKPPTAVKKVARPASMARPVSSAWEGWSAPVRLDDEPPAWVTIASTLTAIAGMALVAFLMWVAWSVWRAVVR